MYTLDRMCIIRIKITFTQKLHYLICYICRKNYICIINSFVTEFLYLHQYIFHKNYPYSLIHFSQKLHYLHFYLYMFAWIFFQCITCRLQTVLDNSLTSFSKETKARWRVNDIIWFSYHSVVKMIWIISSSYTWYKLLSIGFTIIWLKPV